MAAALDDLTLDELLAEVRSRLDALGLADPFGDARVSPVPDARTVRYYSALGLVDRPAMQGRDARYGQRHVLQILSVKALQAHGLRLDEIQRRLYGRSDKELETLIAAARRATPPAAAVTAMIWREIPLAPGLKVMAEERWAAGDTEALVSAFRAAIAAFSRPAAKRGKDA